MKRELDDLLDAVFGNKKPSAIDQYQVDKNMTLVFGDETVSTAAAPKAEPVANVLPLFEDDFLKNNSDILAQKIEAQRADIAALNASARAEIERIERELDTVQVQNLSAQPATSQTAAQALPTASTGIEGFDALSDKLSEQVFGQEFFLRALTIALKRPFVMGHQGDTARNSFFVSGAACTGKHLALDAALQELCTRGVLPSSEIAFVDLSLYPTPTQEKVFLQDLYMALASDAAAVVFTNYEQCHRGFLTVVSNLVIHGESVLASRYLLQDGKLVEAGSALVANAVRALTPRGKYLVMMSAQSAEKLAGAFGAPFLNALHDFCTTEPLSKEALVQISQTQCDAFCKRAKDTLQCAITVTPQVHALAAVPQPQGGAQAVIAFWQDAYRALAQYQLEHDTAAKTATLLVENNLPSLCIDEQTFAIESLLPQAYTGQAMQLQEELDKIIGLDEVKEYIFQLKNNLAIQNRRKAMGIKTAPISMHMIFSGNPGTGKTTIARLISQYLKSIGVLSGGQLIEVSRADLVGKYVGHTAPLTTQVIQSALGGVLFIDEAYSLYRGRDDSFGLEAIDTLVKGMEDHRDSLVVILAGYTKEMAEFLTANSGLKSRFANNIVFPDYTGSQLLDITKLQAASKEYTLDETCDEPLRAYYTATQLLHAADAGNGRLARNTLEDAILQQAKRCAADEAADLSLLLADDFILPLPKP